MLLPAKDAECNASYLIGPVAKYIEEEEEEEEEGAPTAWTLRTLSPVLKLTSSKQIFLK